MSFTPPTSKSAFHDKHENNAVGKPAADDQEISQGGPAVTDHKAKQAALKTGPFINATPKFSSGPNSTVPTFPTVTDTTERHP